MLLIMQHKQAPTFCEEGFQPPTPSQSWEIVKNANIFLMIPKMNLASQGLIHAVQWQEGH